MSELLICPYCRVEYELQSSFKDDEEIVSQTHCKCIKRINKEKFDLAIKEVARLFNIKLKEVTNEKSKSSSRKVSR